MLLTIQSPASSINLTFLWLSKAMVVQGIECRLTVNSTTFNSAWNWPRKASIRGQAKRISFLPARFIAGMFSEPRQSGPAAYPA